jgi:hypothetical protein
VTAKRRALKLHTSTIRHPLRWMVTFASGTQFSSAGSGHGGRKAEHLQYRSYSVNIFFIRWIVFFTRKIYSSLPILAGLGGQAMVASFSSNRQSYELCVEKKSRTASISSQQYWRF